MMEGHHSQRVFPLIATDPSRVTAMLNQLTDYLRTTQHTLACALHALSAEFERLNDYLSLMAVRMGPRLTCTLDLPDELASLPVPTLLLLLWLGTGAAN